MAKAVWHIMPFYWNHIYIYLWFPDHPIHIQFIWIYSVYENNFSMKIIGCSRAQFRKLNALRRSFFIVKIWKSLLEDTTQGIFFFFFFAEIHLYYANNEQISVHNSQRYWDHGSEKPLEKSDIVRTLEKEVSAKEFIKSSIYQVQARTEYFARIVYKYSIVYNTAMYLTQSRERII